MIKWICDICHDDIKENPNWITAGTQYENKDRGGFGEYKKIIKIVACERCSKVIVERINNAVR